VPEIDDILTAIREVEKSLDHRIERVQGALMVMWGVVAALIALFYQAVVLDPRPFVDAIGVFGVSWAWVLFVGAGYAISIVAGARVGRLEGAERTRREALRDALPGAVSSLIAFVLVLVGRPNLIAGALLLGFGATCYLRTRKLRVRGASLAVAAACALAGIALLARPFAWQWLVCAILFGGGLMLLGWLRMARAR